MLNYGSSLLFLAIVLAGTAHAHAKIVSTVPADGDFVAPPQSLVLNFDNVVRLTGLELHTVDGKLVDLGTVDKENARSFEIRLSEPLRPGEYYVVWRSIAIDRHFSTGEFFFTVVAE